MQKKPSRLLKCMFPSTDKKQHASMDFLFFVSFNAHQKSSKPNNS